VLVRPEHVHITPGGAATVTLVEYYCHDSVILVETSTGDSVRVRTMFTTLQRGDAVSVSYAGPPTAAYSAVH
jgi:TOBE domain